MNDLLDQVIGNTGTKIVSEQNDLNAINFVAGLADPGEMIRCGYMPEMRRQDGEQDAEYAERIRPLVMALPQAERDLIMNAAIKRASLDTTNGKIAVMVAGAPAWHRLGVNVANAVNAADAIKLAGLDWTVSRRRLSYQKADGTYAETPADYAIVRDDNERHLGTVGSVYREIANHSAFDFLDSVMGEFGGKYHTAGSVYGGKKVWMQCELPNQTFEVVKGDEVQAFATFTNVHDGSGKAWAYPTVSRIVCANSMRVASADRGKGIGLRHSGDIFKSIAQARQAMGLAVQQIDQYHEAATVMAHETVDAPAFFVDLLDACLDVTAADALKGADALAAALLVTDAQRELERKKLARKINARQNILEDILSRYEGEKCGVGGIRGTKWSALQAVTEHTNWSKPGRRVGTEEARASSRFESVLEGDRDNMNQIAYQMLTADRATVA